MGQTFGCKQLTDVSAFKRIRPENRGPADYSLTIAVTPLELAPNHIVSTATYNGQFPGPLLHFKEGKQVTIDIHNQTDTPEQLHWHGQFLSADVDGSAEEGTPFIPPHGSRRITFVPKPSGYRFYHTHVRAGANLGAGQYTGLEVWFISNRRTIRASMIARFSLRSRNSSFATCFPAAVATWT